MRVYNYAAYAKVLELDVSKPNMTKITKALFNTTKAYVNRVIKGQGSVVNNTFVKMMETLGYDIELRYVERGK